MSKYTPGQFWDYTTVHLMPFIRACFYIEDRIPPRFLNLLAQIRDQEEGPRKPFAWS